MGLDCPNIERLLAALHHRKLDRVPNLEATINAPACSYLLGRRVDQGFWGLSPQDAVRVAQRVVQDAVFCSVTWGPKQASVLSHRDVDALEPPDPQHARAAVESYLDAARGTGVGVCARISAGLTLTYMAIGPVPIQSFMYMMYDQPGLVERLMDLFVDHHVRVIEAIGDLPFHLYYIGDDIASTTGPLISLEHLRRLWAPRVERLVSAALATGRPVIFHCCGKADAILPYLIEWGVNALHPIQPVANDIYAIHARYGSRLTLIGNMDVAGVLSFGTPEQVRQDTRQHIERLAGDGGYVVCSSHSIIDSVPPENYLAMVGAAREFGRYS
jgi:uroporphyrinogen decarboxylase